MKKPDKAVIVDMLNKSMGNVSVAAKSLGTSRVSLYKWIKDYDIESALDDAREVAIDFVESKLMANIERGDTTAIIFYLKTQGKRRGYYDKGDDTRPNTTINIVNGKELPEDI